MYKGEEIMRKECGWLYSKNSYIPKELLATWTLVCKSSHTENSLYPLVSPLCYSALNLFLSVKKGFPLHVTLQHTLQGRGVISRHLLLHIQDRDVAWDTKTSTA